MAKHATIKKEDMTENDLNEWGYPNDNFVHVGNGRFITRPSEEVNE